MDQPEPRCLEPDDANVRAPSWRERLPETPPAVAEERDTFAEAFPTAVVTSLVCGALSGLAYVSAWIALSVLYWGLWALLAKTGLPLPATPGGLLGHVLATARGLAAVLPVALFAARARRRLASAANHPRAEFWGAALGRATAASTAVLLFALVPVTGRALGAAFGADVPLVERALASFGLLFRVVILFLTYLLFAYGSPPRRRCPTCEATLRTVGEAATTLADADAFCRCLQTTPEIALSKDPAGQAVEPDDERGLASFMLLACARCGFRLLEGEAEWTDSPTTARESVRRELTQTWRVLSWTSPTPLPSAFEAGMRPKSRLRRLFL